MKFVSLFFLLLLPLTAAFERPLQRARVDDEQLSFKSRIVALTEEDFGRFLHESSSNVTTADAVSVCEPCAAISVNAEDEETDFLTSILAGLGELFFGEESIFGYLLMAVLDLFSEGEEVSLENLLPILVEVLAQFLLILSGTSAVTDMFTEDTT